MQPRKLLLARTITEKDEFPMSTTEERRETKERLPDADAGNRVYRAPPQVLLSRRLCLREDSSSPTPSPLPSSANPVGEVALVLSSKPRDHRDLKIGEPVLEEEDWAASRLWMVTVEMEADTSDTECSSVSGANFFPFAAEPQIENPNNCAVLEESRSLKNPCLY